MKDVFFEIMREFSVYAATAFYSNHKLVACKNGDRLYTDEFTTENVQPDGTLIIEYPFELAFSISTLAHSTIECRLKQMGYTIVTYNNKHMIIKKVSDIND